MLRIAVKSFHQISTSVCDFITNSYHVTYSSGEDSPKCNIKMCLHYEQITCYVWQWGVFTRWHYQYVSALRKVTMLPMKVEGTYQMAASVCVCITNRYHVTYGSGEYPPDGNKCMCLHFESLGFYVWLESIHQMAISVWVCITNSYRVTYGSGECSPDGNISMCLHYE